jgi:hypothetical protein
MLPRPSPAEHAERIGAPAALPSVDLHQTLVLTHHADDHNSVGKRRLVASAFLLLGPCYGERTGLAILFQVVSIQRRAAPLLI